MIGYTNAKIRSEASPLRINAVVRWFDSMRGEGVLRLDDDTCRAFHFTDLYTPTDGNYHYPSETMQDKLGEWLVKGAELEINNDSGKINLKL